MAEESIAAYNRGENSQLHWTFSIPHAYRGRFTEGQIKEAVKDAIRGNCRLVFPYVYCTRLPGRVFNGSVAVQTGARVV